MMKQTVFVVTVTKGDSTARKERFSNKENLEKWLKYMKETSSAKYEVAEEEADSLFSLLMTYEGRWFPTGKETEDMLEIARGIKLGLTTGTWVPDPNPNPSETIWRPKIKQ